jgi:hypothetical protein
MSTDTHTATDPERCAHCRTGRLDEWRVRGSFLRMEMRRHDLTFRELQIAELILDKTYGWQRAEVVFPQLRFFTDLTGIGEPDVVKVLKTLHARRVIRIITVKGRPTYSINGDTESWKAMPRVSKATMQATLNLMREHNGLEPVPVEQEAALNFKNEADAKNFDAVIGDSPMVMPKYNLTAEFPNLL